MAQLIHLLVTAGKEQVLLTTSTMDIDTNGLQQWKNNQLRH